MCGLYVHIPFCVKKCKYCDFNSFSGFSEEIQSEYFSCLEKEVEKTIKDGLIFDTVYIGGGTPTAPPNYLLVNLIKSITNRTEDCEITVECNPGTVTFAELQNLRKAGANRLSIGFQSADDDELEFLGRIHKAKEAEVVFCNARAAGFDNISVDIMFGLPNQTMGSFKRTLEKVVTFKSEHISCYCLKIEEGTPFATMNLNLPDDDYCADMYDFCVEFLKEHGYNRYEISNFAKENRISKHNTKYWIMQDYVGIGAGAHSFYMGERYSKICDVKQYIKEISNCEDAEENRLNVSLKEQMSEFMFLGLRMTGGVCDEEFYKRFGRKITDVYGEIIGKYTDMGVMVVSNGRISLKPEFLYVSNNILSDFV